MDPFKKRSEMSRRNEKSFFERVSDAKEESQSLNIVYPMAGFFDKFEPPSNIEEAINKIGTYDPEAFEHVVNVINKVDDKNNLTFNNKVALSFYTCEFMLASESLYYNLNSHLRNNNRNLLIPWRGYLFYLLQGLLKLPKLNNLGSIYRVVGGDLYDYYKAEIGKEIIWHGFSSCSYNQKSIDKFHQNGQRTLFILDDVQEGRSIYQYSAFPEEEEILVFPSTKFEVIDVKRGTDQVIITLRQVQNKDQDVFLSSIPISDKLRFPTVKMIQGTQLHDFLTKALSSSIKRGNSLIRPKSYTNEWLIHNVIEYYNKINRLFYLLDKECTTTGCPEMSAGPRFPYLWSDGKIHPTKVSAPDYIDRFLTWMNEIFDDVFPIKVDRPLPNNFLMIVKTIFQRFIRVYAHVYHSHFQKMTKLGEVGSLNGSFSRLYLLGTEYRLLEEEDVAPFIATVEY
eukprot:TRINITY_DN15773_c0_g1_i1.p1 TRINITY_DN15773_c0_g1~~TRINITY_DN15773_c0_g1_i1.p1  ORF type:complete len:453 (+),score=51.63 TRINITY_DN15773_c0_g1_i1:146-1504(+)